MRLAPILQPLTEPLLSPLVTAITGASGGGFSPISLFSGTDKGYIYDNNDYVNPTTWRRNLLTYSEQFDNAAWLKQATGTGVIPVVTANFGVAPDGTTTADRIVFDLGATPASAYSRVGQFNLTTNTSIRSKSIWLKTTDGSTKTLYFQGPQSGQTILTVTGTWTRFSVSDTTAQVAAYAQMQFGLDATTSTTASILAWGAQLEENAPAPTDYQRITDFNSDFLADYPSTTLFVDSAGTQPATVNGLVGLQLDKSGGLALGSELLGTGTTLLIGTATASSYNTTTGEGSVSRAADFNNQSVVQFASLNASAFYKIVISNTGATSLNVHSSGGAVLITTITAGNSATLYSLAVGGNFQVRATSNSTTATFTVSSIREYAGNHRYQTTTGSKPILRGTPTGANLVTNGDFAGGTTTGWTASANATISNVSNRLRVTAIAGGTAASAVQGIATTSGRVYRVTLNYSTDAGTGNAFLYVGSTSSAADRALLNFGSTTRTAVIYFTATGTTSYIQLSSSTAILAGEYHEWDNIEVVDVSADAVTAPYGLQYDGVDDFLTTASVDFTATDKMAVVMGVRKLSDAARGVLAELSADTGSNNGVFVIDAPLDATNKYRITSKGTVLASALTQSASFNAPITTVVSCTANISGDSVAIRLNGVLAQDTTTDQGTGNFGNYALYFGRRGGTTFPMNGLDFGGVCIGKTLTATQLASVEKWVSLRTGVTI